MPTLTASRIRVIAGTVLALGVFAGCSASGAGTSDPYAPAAASSTQATTQPTPQSTTSQTAASAPTLRMADTALGSVLVDGKGMTLYLFTKDSPNTSTCTGGCLAAWPALLGVPTPGAGVDDSKLGSFTRGDGSVQATYNGWPLYFWAKDTKPGDTTGQNVQSVWFVISRDGNPVK